MVWEYNLWYFLVSFMLNSTRVFLEVYNLLGFSCQQIFEVKRQMSGFEDILKIKIDKLNIK